MSKAKVNSSSYDSRAINSQAESLEEEIRILLLEICEKLDLSLEDDFDLSILKDSTFYLEIFKLTFNSELFEDILKNKKFRAASPADKIQFLINILCKDVLGTEIENVNGEDIFNGRLESTYNLLQVMFALVSVDDQSQKETESFAKLEKEILHQDRRKKSPALTEKLKPNENLPISKRIPRFSTSEGNLDAKHSSKKARANPKTARKDTSSEMGSNNFNVSEIPTLSAGREKSIKELTEEIPYSSKTSEKTPRTMSNCSRKSSLTSSVYLRKTESALATLLQRQKLELNSILRGEHFNIPNPRETESFQRKSIRDQQKTLQQLEKIEKVEHLRMQELAATQLRHLFVN